MGSCWICDSLKVNSFDENPLSWGLKDYHQRLPSRGRWGSMMMIQRQNGIHWVLVCLWRCTFWGRGRIWDNFVKFRGILVRSAPLHSGQPQVKKIIWNHPDARNTKAWIIEAPLSPSSSTSALSLQRPITAMKTNSSSGQRNISNITIIIAKHWTKYVLYSDDLFQIRK